MRSNICFLKLVTFVLVICFLVKAERSIAQCIYQAYESADLLGNTAIHNFSGGTGWEAPWIVQNENITVPGFQSTASSLVYSDLQTIGNKISGGLDYLSFGRRLNTSTSGPFGNLVAQYQDGLGTETGDTVWVSFLLRKEQNNNQIISIDLNESSLPWYWDYATDDNIGIGYYGSSYHVGGDRHWHMRINDVYYDTGVEVGVNTTNLVVYRLIFDTGNTEVSLYFNPTDLGHEMPVSSTLTQNTGRENVIRSMGMYLGDTPGNGSIDEIRFASSYECVTPDAAVVVNLPPEADFTMSATGGTAPATITFDGSPSSDPESQPLTYTWDFGDGSPAVTGSSMIAHTFTSLGEIPVSLTVTDDLNLEHTLFQTVTILDANGTYPCQTSVTPINLVSCGANDGAIRVNAGSNSITLYDEANNIQTITNGNEYNNLVSGSYELTVSGSICRDTFQIEMPVDSTTCPSWEVSECSMDIGTNMTGFSDWSRERPMKNLFKHVRENIIAFGENCFCWNSEVADQLTYDADGYPTQIPQVTSVGNTLVRYVISSDGGNFMVDSSYVILFDGTGTVELDGMTTIISSGPNRIEFTALNEDNFALRIMSSQSSDHIRNIRIVRPQHEFTDLVSEPFYEAYKEKIDPFQVLRFMDWGSTNGNINSAWAARSSTSYFTYAGPQGVPYEVMIQLANITQKDVWICVPHEADDAYITQMATMFRDSLHSNLTIYLEYSNEIWNWIFPQAHYNNDNKPENLSYGRAMAQKAGNVFNIWHTVFGDDKCKVKRVLGLQGGFNSLNEQIVSQLPQDQWDFGSPTHYFGLDHGASGTPVLSGSSTVADIMTNTLNSWNAFRPSIRQDYDLVKLFGKKIITYEGGQHFVGNSFGIPYPYQQAMWDAQNSVEMYDMYHMMHDTIRSWGCQLATNFSLATVQESVYGSWGVLSDIDQPGPYNTTARKYLAVLESAMSQSCRSQISWVGDEDNSWSNPCNWDKSKVPDAMSNVIIKDGAPYDPNVDVNAEVNSLETYVDAVLTIMSGYTLLINQDQ